MGGGWVTDAANLTGVSETAISTPLIPFP